MTAAESTATSLPPGEDQKRPSPTRLFIRRYGTLSLSATVLVLAACLAAVASLIVPYNPDFAAPAQRLLPPGGSHLFGTDTLGRDIFSRMIMGTRISVFVSFAVALITFVVGVILGVVAGWYPRLEALVLRLCDGLMTFPGIILAIGLMAALGPSITNVIVALSVVYVPRITRVVHATVLSLREMQYIEAARAIGCSDLRTLRLYVLPNIIGSALVQFTFAFSYALLAESSLSFLGVGMPPWVPSWGNMISEGRTLISVAPWMVIFPGSAILILVVSVNLLGDSLRDVFDPHQRNR